MAWLQCRNGSWRVMFRYKGTQHTFLIGEVHESEARAVSAKTDYWLMRLKQHLVQLPPGCNIVTFVQHDGHPPEFPVLPRKEYTLAELQDRYLKAQEGKLEANNLDVMSVHFRHLVRLIGGKKLLPLIGRTELQDYIDRRSAEWIDPNVYLRKRREKLANHQPKRHFKRPRPAEVLPADKPLRHPSPVTVKKEIITLGTAWSWARRALDLKEPFPGVALEYPKGKEALPFMTWEEAEARIAAGDDAKEVWDCLYLRPREIEEVLGFVKFRPVSACVYPMFVLAAHSGARRSEIVRALPSDVDLAAGVLTIREKKRDKSKVTTRRVPLTPLLRAVLSDWLKQRPKGKTLFCKADGSPVSPNEARSYFQRALRPSKWKVLKGWHVFRHSFISALASKGIDQRIIDDMVGHQTEEQRRRYRHLYPDVKVNALNSVFG
jgi:integrase